ITALCGGSALLRDRIDSDADGHGHAVLIEGDVPRDLADLGIGRLIAPGDRSFPVTASECPIGCHALVGTMADPLDFLQLRHVDIAAREIEDEAVVLLVEQQRPLSPTELDAIVRRRDRVTAAQDVDAIIEAFIVAGGPGRIDMSVGHDAWSSRFY